MARKRTGPRRIFTIEEANAALPLVRAIVSDLAELSCEVIERRRRLSLLLDGRAADSSDPYREELVQIAEELEKDSRRLREYVQELWDLGVEPTSGPEGLVDFPAVVDGRKVDYEAKPTLVGWKRVAEHRLASTSSVESCRLTCFRGKS